MAKRKTVSLWWCDRIRSILEKQTRDTKKLELLEEFMIESEIMLNNRLRKSRRMIQDEN